MNEFFTLVSFFQWGSQSLKCRFIRKSYFFPMLIQMALAHWTRFFWWVSVSISLSLRIYCPNAFDASPVIFYMSSTSHWVFYMLIHCRKRGVYSLIDFLSIGDALIPSVSYGLTRYFLGRSHFLIIEKTQSWVLIHKNMHPVLLILFFQ